MPPSLNEREPERGERPAPRFSNFSFNRLLPNRQSSSTGSKNAGASSMSQTVISGQSPVQSPPAEPVGKQFPLPQILDLLAHNQVDSGLSTGYVRDAISQLAFVSPSPEPDAIAPVLLNVCSANSPSELRLAGFDLLATYLTSTFDAPTDLSTINRATFWLIIKDAGTHLGASFLEWQSRSAALSILTADGREVDGIQGLMTFMCMWAERAAFQHSRPHEGEQQDDVVEGGWTAAEAEKCLSWCLTFINNVVRLNAQTLTSSTVGSLIRNLDRIVVASVGATERSSSNSSILSKVLDEGRSDVAPNSSASALLQSQALRPPALSASRSFSNLNTPSISSQFTPSSFRTHNRNPSTTHLSPETSRSAVTPSPQPDTYASPSPVHVIPATQYIEFIKQLLKYSIIPHTSLPQTIGTLMLVFCKTMELSDGLPTLTLRKSLTSASRTSMSPTPSGQDEDKVLYSQLEIVIWDIMRNFLSDPTYSASTARILKKLVTRSTPADSGDPSVHVPFFDDSLPAKHAAGAARVIRLALRQAAEGRLARSWLATQVASSYAPSGAPTFLSGSNRNQDEREDNRQSRIPELDDIMQRAWGKEGEGGAWETDKVSGLLPEAVRIWVGSLNGTDIEDNELGMQDDSLVPTQRVKELIVIECLGIVNDLVDEVIQINAANEVMDLGPSNRNLAAMGVLEGQLVGDVLKEAVRCVEQYRCKTHYVLQVSWPPTRQPNPLLQTLVGVIVRLWASHPRSDLSSRPLQNQGFSSGNAILPSSITPSIPSTLLSIARYLTDDTLANIVLWYLAEGSLNPSSPEWLVALSALFDAVGMLDTTQEAEAMNAPGEDLLEHRLARNALSQALSTIYQGVRDHRPHRLAVLELCLARWESSYNRRLKDVFSAETSFIMSDGIVAGAAEERVSGSPEKGSHGTSSPAGVPTEGSSLELRIRQLLCQMARRSVCSLEIGAREMREGLTTAAKTPLTASTAIQSPGGSSTSSSTVTSPMRHTSLSTALATEHLQEREPGVLALMPLLNDGSSSTRGTASDSVQSPSRIMLHVKPETSGVRSGQFMPPQHQNTCQSLTAVLTLIQTFQQLAFSPPHSLTAASVAARAPASHQCIHIFTDLLSLLGPDTIPPLTEEDKTWHERAIAETSPTGIGQASCPRARLTILQWLVRLRADRDHRLYLLKDLDQQMEPYASLLGRCGGNDLAYVENPKLNDSRDKMGAGRSRSTTRRSIGGAPEGPRRGVDQAVKEGGSFLRATSRGRREPSVGRVERNQLRLDALSGPIWGVPESLSFDIPIGTRPSEGMSTYQAGMSGADAETVSLWLPTSAYICSLIDIINYESDWEILSYAMCHLPIQLANKHLFCGPMTSRVIPKLAATLLDMIQPSGRLAGSEMESRSGVKATDVLAVAYYGLTTLMSYKKLFNRRLLEAMVDTFRKGLNKVHAPVKPCLHALTLAAFELQSHMTRNLRDILIQLTQIVTNPAVSIHILELLIILGSIPALHTNLTSEDYKKVFTVALKYIQHHNHPDTVSPPGLSNALSQHLLAIAYYNIYVWFLALRQPDRAQYVPYIVKNLMHANSHNAQKDFDERTEVCFDWLARYTYGDAEPKPSRSFLGDALSEEESVVNEKHWMQGNTITTIRSLKRQGWVSVESRRPSGTVRLYCHVENAAALGIRLVEPSEAGDAEATPKMSGLPSLPNTEGVNITKDESSQGSQSAPEVASRGAPGPSGSSWPGPGIHPKLKDIVLDPSYLALMVSPLPTSNHPGRPARLLQDTEVLKRTLRNLDYTPVIDSHTIGVLYVAPGQTTELEILGNRHGSPAYARFLQGLGRLIKLRGQKTVYTGAFDSHNDVDGQYAYAWWDDIAQVLYHTATIMPNPPGDAQLSRKKMHIGNDYVRIVWNDSGTPYQFDTLKTEFQFANIIIEPHSAGASGAYSSSLHEHEFFKVSCQRAPGTPEFGPLGHFKLVSFESLPSLVRQVSLLADFFAPVWRHTQQDTRSAEYVTNWRVRLQTIKRYQASLPALPDFDDGMSKEQAQDFTQMY
ncbi:Tuberous sclerosis 2-like protein [Tulasnella sp. JGI-2019a]|nr:Tuberous sclerosis 2-like protein [Tulasnella sp. JGI-2019a]